MTIQKPMSTSWIRIDGLANKIVSSMNDVQKKLYGNSVEWPDLKIPINARLWLTPWIANRTNPSSKLDYRFYREFKISKTSMLDFRQS